VPHDSKEAADVGHNDQRHGDLSPASHRSDAIPCETASGTRRLAIMLSSSWVACRSTVQSAPGSYLYGAAPPESRQGRGADERAAQGTSRVVPRGAPEGP
jgi:hypothetical protein